MGLSVGSFGFLLVPSVVSGMLLRRPFSVAGLAGMWGPSVGPGLVVFCGMRGSDFVFRKFVRTCECHHTSCNVLDEFMHAHV